MSASAQIKRAHPRDVDVLLRLVAEYYAFDEIAFDAAAVRRGLQILLNDEMLGGAWLVQRDGEAIGYFVLTYGFDLELGGRQATVTELYFRPTARHEGLGSAAIRFIERHLRGCGMTAYELQVERDNADARAFYAKHGFVAHDRIPLTKYIVSPSPQDLAHHAPRVTDTVDHVSLGVNDLAASKRFYDAALAPLGFQAREDTPGEVGYFRDADTNHTESFALFIGFEDPTMRREVHPSAGLHIAFRAPSREVVTACYDAALNAGGRDNGAPGLRPGYHRDYFAAFVLDPDGHHIEVVCHRPESH